MPVFSGAQCDGLHFIFVQPELKCSLQEGQGKPSSSVKPASVARGGLGNPETFGAGGCTLDEAGDAGREKPEQLHDGSGK